MRDSSRSLPAGCCHGLSVNPWTHSRHGKFFGVDVGALGGIDVHCMGTVRGRQKHVSLCQHPRSSPHLCCLQHRQLFPLLLVESLLRHQLSRTRQHKHAAALTKYEGVTNPETHTHTHVQAGAATAAAAGREGRRVCVGIDYAARAAMRQGLLAALQPMLHCHTEPSLPCPPPALV